MRHMLQLSAALHSNLVRLITEVPDVNPEVHQKRHDLRDGATMDGDGWCTSPEAEVRNPPLTRPRKTTEGRVGLQTPWQAK